MRKLQDRLDWIMGVWHEEDKAYIGDIVCENTDCSNFGNFTNCYDESRETCYQYSLFIKGKIKNE